MKVPTGPAEPLAARELLRRGPHDRMSLFLCVVYAWPVIRQILVEHSLGSCKGKQSLCKGTWTAYWVGSSAAQGKPRAMLSLAGDTPAPPRSAWEGLPELMCYKLLGQAKYTLSCLCAGLPNDHTPGHVWISPTTISLGRTDNSCCCLLESSPHIFKVEKATIRNQNNLFLMGNT